MCIVLCGSHISSTTPDFMCKESKFIWVSTKVVVRKKVNWKKVKRKKSNGKKSSEKSQAEKVIILSYCSKYSYSDLTHMSTGQRGHSTC